VTSIINPIDNPHTGNKTRIAFLMHNVGAMNLFSKLNTSFIDEVGGIARFTGRFFRELFRPRQETEEFIRQCFWVGYRSLSLVAITAFIMGLVLTIQSRPTLVEFGAESLLPSMVSVSLVREIAPVITALICAGKIGSGMGAELGSMKVTEQIDAMEVSGKIRLSTWLLQGYWQQLLCYPSYQAYPMASRYTVDTSG
jgi:ABC transport permease subunit